jgi:hypothetical protein
MACKTSSSVYAIIMTKAGDCSGGSAKTAMGDAGRPVAQHMGFATIAKR